MKKERAFIPPPGAEELEPGPLDRHFADLLVELEGAPRADLHFAAQLASAWRGAGHVCVPLAELGLTDVAERLRGARAVGAPGAFCPLILDAADRLYLQRYWAHEDSLATALGARLGENAPHDAHLLAAGLERFFPDEPLIDWQRRAAAVAVQKRFAVITGGPGTGKTRTVVVILALLIEQALARGTVPRIALAAPTGKASARLKESIERTAARLALPEEIVAALPRTAQTVHRLLGAIPNSPEFRHDAQHPLAVDAVIIDEASMVDLALMARLAAAVPPQARLILLGDKDQLASVDAGYVLGDICRASEGPLREHLVELQTNYRFGNDSGIYRLGAAANAGQSAQALRILHAAETPDLRYAALPLPAALSEALQRPVLENYRAYLEAANPGDALAEYQRFRILCALRRGPYGVENLNRLVEQSLATAGLIDPVTTHYPGRPILILRNDARLGLFNGDAGLILPDPEEGGALRAFFIDPEGQLRRYLPARLPEHETAFAMTIHKSQGSEFERVLLILTDRDVPIMTRELVYTGLTRARAAVEVWADDAILHAAIARRTERASGLADALGKRSP